MLDNMFILTFFLYNIQLDTGACLRFYFEGGNVDKSTVFEYLN